MTAGVGPAITTATSTTVTQEDALVNVTTPNGVTITIGPSVRRITVKDKSGAVNPVISVTAGNGATLEDPQNLGVTSAYATTVTVQGQGSAATFWYDGTNYQVSWNA